MVAAELAKGVRRCCHGMKVMVRTWQFCVQERLDGCSSLDQLVQILALVWSML